MNDELATCISTKKLTVRFIQNVKTITLKFLGINLWNKLSDLIILRK